MTKDLLVKAEELMKKAEVATISSIDEDGYPRTATISNLKTEGIDIAWFSTGTSSNKTKNFQRNCKASICYNIGHNSITLNGDITIVEDKNVKEELWQDWFIGHFPLGINDPEYCILKFETKYIQVWIDNIFEDLRFLN